MIYLKNNTMKQINITYDKIPFTVWGYYEKAEPADRDYPGCNSSFSIEEVYLSNSSEDDNLVFIIKENVLDELAELVIEQIENN